MVSTTNKLKAVTVILRASQAIQEVIKKDAATYGLNQTEFAVLELLYHKGDQPIQSIGKKILISSGSITYVVDKLEHKNFAIRKACPDDRRVTFAAITSDGKEFMDRIFPQHETKINEIFEQLADKDINDMIELLKRVGHHAETV
ncbi:MarR family winged helix-turn-helix transcriptional regulator [Paenisporosarcina sp. TG-14]|uniref:MarR family winged helix-turn-helix transcriptional regulator n=1 Tax=Paenisporosarcina sp. TG-14 TaxID=1231057 RepID=UPI0002EC4E1F|nr:MarR family transcriptional regulator [Paenisporosarcina sp. TG-14]